MNTLWLKTAVVLVVLTAGFVVFSSLSSDEEKSPRPGNKTFSEVVEEDDRRLRAEPESVRVAEAAEQTSEEQTDMAEPESSPEESSDNTGNRMQKELEIAESQKPRFRELPLEQRLQAEKLFEMVMFHRKSGRLPTGMGYKKMVDYCREIIEKYPGTEYAFKARRALRDIPERYRRIYNLTDEELGL